MSDLKKFQTEHGQAWAQIVQHPAFAAALAVANSEKLKEIMLLSDSVLKDNPLAILAELRAHLRYENALLTMDQEKELVFSPDPSPDYPGPEEDFQELAEADRESTQQSAEERAVSRLQRLVPIAPIEPEPVRKPRKRKKK